LKPVFQRFHMRGDNARRKIELSSRGGKAALFDDFDE
jgi:hypothetical protein